MKALWLMALCSLLLGTACSRVGGMMSKITPDGAEEEGSATPSIPPQLRSGSGNDELEELESVEVAAGSDPALLSSSQTGITGLPTEDEIEFLDPDDLEGSAALLEELTRGKREVWMSSFTQARRLSVAEGKPLLLWFTDTPGERRVGSPSSMQLERELFARKEFGEWAEENLLRLKLDFNVENRNSVEPTKKTLAIRQEKYLESLKDRFNVRGFPSLIVLGSDGSSATHIRGYRSGDSEYIWGRLRTAVQVASKRQQKYEAKLARKGYRHWTGENDVSLFARLASYQKGELVLVGPDGARYKTKESSLSAEDRAWIEAEKAKRNSS
ncbi:MAG: hypothetical protein Q7Q71_16065 [Verrucomicrobiota bacterium JB023]|nr:hypothetical protein [Verrucomicrobiota bacterium JB023]